MSAKSLKKEGSGKGVMTKLAVTLAMTAAVGQSR